MCVICYLHTIPPLYGVDRAYVHPTHRWWLAEGNGQHRAYIYTIYREYSYYIYAIVSREGAGAQGVHPTLVRRLKVWTSVQDPPSQRPTSTPTTPPTNTPSVRPSITPTVAPTQPPTFAPTTTPSLLPTTVSCTQCSHKS